MNNKDSITIVPIADSVLLKEHGIFYSPKTLRKWHHEGTNPQVFLKLGGRLYILVEEWQKILAQAREQTQARVDSLKRKDLLG